MIVNIIAANLRALKLRKIFVKEIIFLLNLALSATAKNNFLTFKFIIMKYPLKQYQELTAVLKQLAVCIDLRTINPSALHFIAFQQCSEGQKHNWFMAKGNELKKAYKLENLEGWVKWIENTNPDFLLYPEGCNDNHIETAIKKAMKELY
jgi:hypothetical protein